VFATAGQALAVLKSESKIESGGEFCDVYPDFYSHPRTVLHAACVRMLLNEYCRS